MADLKVNFAGISSSNPFWLASAPPTNTGDQVMRAFDAGWGGAVWKTIGEPIVNVSSRYSTVDLNGQKVMGLNNIELITDRPIAVNLREVAEVKKRYPKHAVIVSLMVESKREKWHEIVKAAEGAGADGLELNFGCPHGMSERGMGSAVGQVPDYACQITTWVKPIALNMVSSVAKDADVKLPISGIGGISNWRDAAEFLLLGCTTVQVCTAVMHYGFRIVEDMIDGLSNYLDEKGFRSVNEI